MMAKQELFSLSTFHSLKCELGNSSPFYMRKNKDPLFIENEIDHSNKRR